MSSKRRFISRKIERLSGKIAKLIAFELMISKTIWLSKHKQQKIALIIIANKWSVSDVENKETLVYMLLSWDGHL